MTSDGGSLLEGVYGVLITAHLQKRLDEAGDIDAPRAAVADADEPEVLSRHVAQAVARVLRSERNPELRVGLVNRVLGVLGSDEDAVVGRIAPAAGGVLRGRPPPAPVDSPAGNTSSQTPLS